VSTEDSAGDLNMSVNVIQVIACCCDVISVPNSMEMNSYKNPY
jgi:hypothetical protein